MIPLDPNSSKARMYFTYDLPDKRTPNSKGLDHSSEYLQKAHEFLWNENHELEEKRNNQDYFNCFIEGTDEENQRRKSKKPRILM